MTVEFKPTEVGNFMGGEFAMKDIHTTGQLKEALQSIIAEVDDWGDDDVKISEIWMIGDQMQVTLEDGVPKSD